MYINRTDMVQVVNQWLMAHRRTAMPQRLFHPHQWQQAMFVARQNRIFSPEALKALAKNGGVMVKEK
jgi:hypothetical protein